MKNLVFTIIGFVVVFTMTTCTDQVIKLDGARLSPKELVLLEGADAKRVYIHLYPDNTTEPEVTWVSDHPELASVDQKGMVSPLAPGKTFIRIFKGDRELDASAITVTPFIHVESISLNKNVIDCVLGEKGLKLTATVLPKEASKPTVKWSSDKPNFVKVDDVGNLTTVAPGDAVITATTVDGGKTATCAVKVNYVFVTDLTLSPSDITIYVNESKKRLIATVIPTNATTPTVTWTTSHPFNVSVDDQGYLTALSPGTATITVATTEGGFSKTCNVTIKPERKKGDNLLKNPGFEAAPVGTTAVADWSKVQDTWVKAFPYYLASNTNVLAAADGNADRQTKLSGTFFTGNGSFFANDLINGLVGDHAVRLTANTTGGIYQTVDVEEGASYWISVRLGFRRNTVPATTIRTDQTVKILSADNGLQAYHLEPIIITNPDIPVNTGFCLRTTGSFTIPAGVTQVRFQIDQRSFTGNFQSPLTLVDECEFRKLTEQ